MHLILLRIRRDNFITLIQRIIIIGRQRQINILRAVWQGIGQIARVLIANRRQ
ncbi:hypothetical protein SB00610_04430 [Klebsiella quasipneumoniae subsp. similipneumoniae]|nr:hypothetical protein SB00610_04430 [Klebsiella quasipneumoniae subsp. similipneumoniae]